MEIIVILPETLRSTHEHTDWHTGKKSSWPPCTLHPIKHSDLPPLGFVRHHLPTMCRREETPVPQQKIYSSITIHPDMNILPLHFHTACCVIPFTENGTIIKKRSMWRFKVYCSVTADLFLCWHLRGPQHCDQNKLVSWSFLSARLNNVADTAGPTLESQNDYKFLTLLAQCPHYTLTLGHLTAASALSMIPLNSSKFWELQ